MMLTGMHGVPLDDKWRSHMVRSLFRATRWNRYSANWPIVMAALRELWKAGKVSELKSPFYELVEDRLSK